MELFSIIPQRRPEVATVKTRSLAASLNGELVFIVFRAEIAFRTGFSIHFTSRDAFKCFKCGVLSRLTLVLLTSLLGSVFWRQLRMKAQSLDTNVTAYF